ncbi:lycopene cyclase family protein [Nonlabens ponticola]|uniref:Lycopene cyclase n=1 Tax=Nonlabens ponticola TaxID=2496866 RepID=A0A3S9N027_9FLAO|nr:lycopene cyclase family protein [Nonlabens ponticola]AZQ44896.1 lycopene cyclase [Nonlabens ponticola]
MDHHKYDIAIVGMGCAGSHVLLAMLEHEQFMDKSILILDDYSADSLEKTWSYWEKGTGKWDHLISQQWNQGSFISHNKSIDLDLDPYHYKMIKSVDFIAFAKAKFQHHSNITHVAEKVTDVRQGHTARIFTESCTYQADLVLDSRVSQKFYNNTNAITLKQHFLGWHIRTEKDLFDPDHFVMMDYRYQDPGTTSFMYLLPFEKNEALIEYTYFSGELVDDAVYESKMREYLKKEYKLDEFEIVRIEQGVIPMTTYDFTAHNTQVVHKIGTAGGWVKASTGYSFKMSEKRAAQLVDNYITGKDLGHNMQEAKYRWYDQIMLDVLHQDNGRGDKVFTTLYSKNDIQRIFAFLDEETTFQQELQIMLPMTSYPFVRSAVTSFFK